MTKYPIEVFWNDEDEGYIAVVPDLPGCNALASAPLTRYSSISSPHPSHFELKFTYGPAQKQVW